MFHKPAKYFIKNKRVYLRLACRISVKNEPTSMRSSYLLAHAERATCANVRSTMGFMVIAYRFKMIEKRKDPAPLKIMVA